MSTLLKQSTAVDIAVGPFLDETDGKTAETALTITQPDIRLKKNGGAWAQKSAAQTLSHEEAGWYECSLSTTDTDTLGELVVAIHESGALPVWRVFQIVPAAVYDALVSGSGNGVRADVQTFAAGAITAAAIATGAIDADAIADNAIDAGAIAADAITAAKIADGAIDANTFAAGAITASAIAADAIGASELAADAVTEIVTAVWAKTMSELASVPGVTGTILDGIEFLFLLAHNKVTQTATTTLLRNDADSATIATSTVSDDGTTFIRGEFA